MEELLDNRCARTAKRRTENRHDFIGRSVGEVGAPLRSTENRAGGMRPFIGTVERAPRTEAVQNRTAREGQET